MHNIEDSNQNVKTSICYGCGQILKNYSFLVCADCLDLECTKFATLIENDIDLDEK